MSGVIAFVAIIGAYTVLALALYFGFRAIKLI